MVSSQHCAPLYMECCHAAFVPETNIQMVAYTPCRLESQHCVLLYVGWECSCVGSTPTLSRALRNRSIHSTLPNKQKAFETVPPPVSTPLRREESDESWPVSPLLESATKDSKSMFLATLQHVGGFAVVRRARLTVDLIDVSPFTFPKQLFVHVPSTRAPLAQLEPHETTTSQRRRRPIAWAEESSHSSFPELDESVALVWHQRRLTPRTRAQKFGS